MILNFESRHSMGARFTILMSVLLSPFYAMKHALLPEIYIFSVALDWI